MSRPAFNAEVIGELRRRVIAHNESCPNAKVKLGDLKRVYAGAHRGSAPGANAMQKVDNHLAGLAKAYNPDEPRDRDGRFTSEGIRRAASSAAEGMKRAAHHAAYQAGFADEPLKSGIKLPKKAPLNMPRHRDVHRALQHDNAGYSALTSAVIPQTRYELYGSAAKNAISAAGGLAVAHMLLSGDKSHPFRRGITNGASVPLGLGGKILTGVPLHTVAWGAEALHGKFGLPKDPAALKQLAYSVSAQADAKTRAAARVLVDKAIGGASVSARRFVDVVEGAPIKPFDEAFPVGLKATKEDAGRLARYAAKYAINRSSRGFRRAGALGMVAALPAVGISAAISNSPVDPEGIGRSWDQYSYRVIHKALLLPETEALRKDMTSALRKAAVMSELDTGIDRLFQRGSRAAIEGASSLTGAALGAAAGATGQAVSNAMGHHRGDPYHDAHGRFTSKENAVNGNGIGRAAMAGAAVGAALGAGAAHGTLGRFNRRQFHAAMDALDSHVGKLTSDALAKPFNGKHALQSVEMLHAEKVKAIAAHDRGSRDAISEAVDFHPAWQAYLDSKKAFGDAEPGYYKDQVRSIITKKLEEALKGFRAPNATYLANASPEIFQAGIKNLTPEQRNAAINLYEMRESAPAKVDDILAAKTGVIKEAQDKLDAKDKALEEASAAVVKAHADLEGHPVEGPEREAATKALADAEAAEKRAQTARSGAHKKLLGLQDKGLEVPHPFKPNETIQKPTENQRFVFEKQLRAPLEKEAAAANMKSRDKIANDYDKKIQKVVDEYVTQLHAEHGAKIAEFVAKGRSAGVLGGVLGKPAKELVKARGEALKAEGVRNSAEAEYAARKAAYQGAPNVNVKDPKAKTDRQHAVQELRDARDRAAKELADATTVHAVAQSRMADKAHDFLGHYHTFREASAKNPVHSFLPPEARGKILDDLKRAGAAVGDPIMEYAVNPSAAGLRSVMQHVLPPVAHAGREIKSLAANAVGNTDDKGNFSLSPTKIALGSSAIGAAGETLRAAANYLHGKANGDPKAKAPTNLKVEIVRSPFKDEGMMLIHAPHPSNKGERIVLLGEKLDGGKTSYVNPGAKLSDVMNQFQNRQNGGGGQGGQSNQGQLPDAGWLGNDKKMVDDALRKIRAGHTEKLSGHGIDVEVRRQDDSDQTHNEAASKFLGAFRGKFLNGNTHKDPGAYYSALNGLFSRQSAVLKRGQMFQALTGYTPKGDKKGNGVFPDNEDFGGDAAEAKGALESEIKRITTKAAPRDGAQRDALRRAVTVIAKSKGISDEDVQPIMAMISGGESHREGQTRIETRTVQVPHIELGEEAPREGQGDIAQYAKPAAQNLARKFGKTSPLEVDTLSTSIAKFSGALVHTEGYSPEVATMIVSRAFERAGQGGQQKSYADLVDLIDREADRYNRENKAEKAEFVVDYMALEDFEGLAKRLPSAVPAMPSDTSTKPAKLGAPTPSETHISGALHPSNSPRPGLHGQNMRGLFHQDRLYATQSVARGFEPSDVRGLARAAQKGVSGYLSHKRQAEPKAPVYKPSVDIASAAADLGASAAANQVLDRVFKTPSFGNNVKLHKPIQSAKGLVADAAGLSEGKGYLGAAKNVAKIGAKGLVASSLGSALYNAVQFGGKGDQYRRTTSTGENVAMGLSNYAGATAGETAAEGAIGAAIGEDAGGLLGTAVGPVGTVVGGAIGGALGEALGHYGYQYFKGYNPHAVSRIMRTKLRPAPGQESLAQTGEVAGGLIGNALGGAKTEGLGGVVGSALGVTAARSAAPAVAPATKPRRKTN